MSGYVATDSSTKEKAKEKAPDKYGIEDVVYTKAHGEGRTESRIDQVLGDGEYNEWKDNGRRRRVSWRKSFQRASSCGEESLGQRVRREGAEKG